MARAAGLEPTTYGLEVQDATLPHADLLSPDCIRTRQKARTKRHTTPQDDYEFHPELHPAFGGAQ